MKKTGISLVPGLIFTFLFSLVLYTVIGPVAAGIFGGLSMVAIIAPMPKNVFGMNNTNGISARMDFDKAKQLFFAGLRNLFPAGAPGDAQCWNFVNGRKLSQNEIRLEVKLNATSNNFVFGLTPSNNSSSGVIFNTEVRLQQQDSFVASEYGVFVGEPASDTDTAWEIQTQGNPIVQGAATALALNTTFYGHSNFRMTANNDVVIPYRGLFNHWYRPQTQQTSAFGAGSPANQIRGAEDGMITMEPNIFLIGTKGYLPQLILPVNLANVGTFTRAILIFRGILAQNSTTVS